MNSDLLTEPKPIMRHHSPNPEHLGYTRRKFLSRSGMGLGALGMGDLLANANPLLPKAPHFRPRAKRIIHLFMNGGPSHVDTFDPKPALTRYGG